MPRTPGKALADTRHAIVQKIRAMKRNPAYDKLTLGALEAWIGSMDERALTRKGGVVLPRRPLKKLGRKS